MRLDKLHIKSIITLTESDHSALVLTLPPLLQPNCRSQCKSEKKDILNFSLSSLSAFKNDLNNVTWKFNNTLTVDENFNSFLQDFGIIFDKHFKKRRVDVANASIRWATRGIKISAERKKLLHSHNPKLTKVRFSNNLLKITRKVLIK